MIEEYAPNVYGFSHLGLQEYLAALEIASRGGELIADLGANFGDCWWREVALLAVGLPGPQVFGPLMARLVVSGALFEHADLVRECLREAPEVDLDPFLAVLDGGEPEAQTVVLRLLRGRVERRFLERAAVLAEAEDAGVRALARQIAGEAEEAARGAAAPPPRHLRRPVRRPRRAPGQRAGDRPGLLRAQHLLGDRPG